MANWSQCEEFPKRKLKKGETIRNRNTSTITSKPSKSVTPNLSFAAALSGASNKNSTPGTSATPEVTPLTDEKSNENDFGFKDAINELRRFFLDYPFLLEMEEKIAIIKRKGLCRICLAKGHLASRCRSQITCQLCSKRHVKFMCPNIECNKSDSLKQDVNDKNINENTVDSLHSRATNEVILQTLVVNVHGIKRERKARAIIDTGSQKSYILRSTAEELGFNLQREGEFLHSLFGGTKTRMYKHKCYKIYLSSLDGNYICKLDALDHDVICNDISSAKNGSWIHELKTKNIFLTDIQENTGPIEVFWVQT
ncbi:CCHC-type domain-containing protein [Trichonephila clavipes]|nr:CCHC-type domain-containing protein [Trichonephila clavipes]